MRPLFAARINLSSFSLIRAALFVHARLISAPLYMCCLPALHYHTARRVSAQLPHSTLHSLPSARTYQSMLCAPAVAPHLRAASGSLSPCMRRAAARVRSADSHRRSSLKRAPSPVTARARLCLSLIHGAALFPARRRAQRNSLRAHLHVLVPVRTCCALILVLGICQIPSCAFSKLARF